MTAPAQQQQTLALLGRQLLRLKDIVPQHLTPERILRVAMMQVDATPQLKNANPITVVRAVLQAAALGLEVGSVLGEAYLVPFDGVVNLIPGYRGLQKLILQGVPGAHDLTSRLVYAGDTFDVTYTSDGDKLVHHPNLSGPREDADIQYVYTRLRYKEGPSKFDVMTRAEWEKRRAVSRAGHASDRNRTPPWVAWYPEMVIKSGIRRFSKTVPNSWQLGAAMELDTRLDVGTPTEKVDALDFDDLESAYQSEAVAVKIASAKEKMSHAARSRLLSTEGASEEYAEAKRQAEMDKEDGA